ncbi:tetratricopeptide repeat protein [Paraburkholderia dilworthii]|uniref:Tetratricopeptide repeat protein n=1 Tax=Paraburkholderia dilworthii TaxID=948106 RepID=A0ABW9D1C9_9BURK
MSKQSLSIPYRDEAAANFDTLIAQADGLFSARRMNAAMNAYCRALLLHPHNAHALHRMALACVHTGEVERARYFLAQAVRAAPEHAELWEHAGLVAAMQDDHATAEAYYRRALVLSVNTASLHRNLADSLRRAGKLTDALTHYERALEIEPCLHHALRAAARISAELGKTEDAADYWLRAWALTPARLQDGFDLIAALARDNRSHELNDVLEQLRTRCAHHAESLKSLAFVLNSHDRFRDALSVARQGLAVDPHHPLLHHNAARALSMLGRLAESLPHGLEAARLLPDNAHLQFQLAGVQLGLGDFAAGWRRYKWFYALPGKDKERVHPSFPEWQGEPVAGCQFLLVGEQGRGDEIQCLRFAAWLHRQGAAVDVLVSQPIVALAASMTGVRSVFATLPPGPYHYHCLMLCMPEPMKLDVSMLPIAMPYLIADPCKTRDWHAHLEAISPRGTNAKRRRVGIVWAGSPAHALDRFRSIRLDALKPLFAFPDIAWYSLQKGEQEHDSESLASTYGDFHTLGPMIHDFADTLAILHSLDLLITVDTSVAHLAGAAALPVWVMVPAYGEWRWLTERTDSPWYPSMRLFRQREPGAWTPIIDEIADALRAWLDAPLRCTSSGCPARVQTSGSEEAPTP